MVLQDHIQKIRTILGHVLRHVSAVERYNVSPGPASVLVAVQERESRPFSWKWRRFPVWHHQSTELKKTHNGRSFDVPGVRWSAGGQEYLWKEKNLLQSESIQDPISSPISLPCLRLDHCDHIVLRFDGQFLVCSSTASYNRKDKARFVPLLPPPSTTQANENKIINSTQITQSEITIY